MMSVGGTAGVRAYPTGEAAGDGNSELVKEAARLRIEAGWDRIDTHLAAHGPWLLGESLSAADFHLTMLMRWSRNMPKPTDQWPVLLAYARRMKARPSLREVYAREGLTDWT